MKKLATFTRALPEAAEYIRLSLSFDQADAKHERAAVLAVVFYDLNGEPVENYDKNLKHNEKYGDWKYIRHNGTPTAVHELFKVPKSAHNVEFHLHDFSRQIVQHLKDVKFDLVDPYDAVDLDSISADNKLAVSQFRGKFEVKGGETGTFRWKIDSTENRDLLVFKYADKAGKILLPPEELPMHEKYGGYSYTVRDGKVDKLHQEITFQVPEGASHLLVEGVPWSKKQAYITEKPQYLRHIEGQNARDVAVNNWLERLTPQNKIIILHTTAGAINPKNKLLLRSNRIAMHFAEHGWSTVLVPFGGSAGQEFIYDVAPNLLQISEEELPALVDSLLAKPLRGNRVYVCSSRTDLIATGIQNRLQDYGWSTVYETRDDMEEFRRVGYSKWYRPALEQRFAEEADAIVATSPRLKERIEAISGSEEVELIPNAGPDSLVHDSKYMRKVNHYTNVRTAPIVGYLGHMTSSWFDWQSITEVAKRNPEITFELVGPGALGGSRLPANVIDLGPMSHEEVLTTVERWRVGLIPFVESRLTYGVDPNKLYEYIAFGLKTVSAPMGRVETAPGVHVYRSVEEFDRLLSASVYETPSSDFYKDCEGYLKTATWSVRANEFSTYLEGIL